MTLICQIKDWFPKGVVYLPSSTSIDVYIDFKNIFYSNLYFYLLHWIVKVRFSVCVNYVTISSFYQYISLFLELCLFYYRFYSKQKSVDAFSINTMILTWYTIWYTSSTHRHFPHSHCVWYNVLIRNPLSESAQICFYSNCLHLMQLCVPSSLNKQWRINRQKVDICICSFSSIILIISKLFCHILLDVSHKFDIYRRIILTLCPREIDVLIFLN